MASDGGAFDAAPPPVGGLGNFKGVMLCNRPSDEPKKNVGGDEGPGAFKSMISATYSEQAGLTPCKNFEPTVKTRGPSAALRRHVQWLRELQDQMRGEREQFENEEQDGEARKERMKEFFSKQREGVRAMMAERDAAKPLRGEAVARPPPGEAAPAKKKVKGPSVAKPLWAMTATEKECFEEEEGDDLIDFAEGLDYDKFIGDLEFKQGLEALRDRAGKLSKEQNSFKDELIKDFNTASAEDDDEDRSTAVGEPLEDGIEGQSLLGDRSEYSVGTSRRSAERFNEDGQPEWDSSTACGDEQARANREAQAAAEMVLECNPQMRQIHSKESVQKMIERAQKKVPPPADLAEMFDREGPVPVPVITQSHDTLNRLHKPADPSLLPYLYRSPAI